MHFYRRVIGASLVDKQRFNSLDIGTEAALLNGCVLCDLRAQEDGPPGVVKLYS